MRIFLLLPFLLLAGCVARIERPYVKETITSTDGTVRTIESSADKIEGAGMGLDKLSPKR